jgi:hypothetical protein
MIDVEGEEAKVS